MRLAIVRLIITGFFILIASALVYLQGLRGHYYYTLSKNNRIRVVEGEARRGRIFDRNGLVVADNRLSFELKVVPQEVRSNDALFSFLGEALEADKMALWATYQRRKVNTFTPVLVAQDVPFPQAIVLAENKFRFPGLVIQVGSKRYYPYHDINAHVLGYVGQANRAQIRELKNYGYEVQNFIGKSGVEEYYDSYLKGELGGLQVEVNNRGAQVRLLSFKEPHKGQDIGLTLDNRLQTAVTGALQGRRGAVVVMNSENGDILALVSAPSFDPNFFIEGDPRVTDIFSDTQAPLLNRAISGQFPPGSVFKVIMAIGAMESNKIYAQTTFACPGYYALGERQFRCSHVHGVQNLTEAIAHSCNVYFFHTGLLLEPLVVHKFATMFGLGLPTSVDLPHEAKGFVPDGRHSKNIRGRRFSKGDRLNLAIGQGDTLATPIQLAQLMATVANAGQPVRPHLIRSIGAQAVSYDAVNVKLPVQKRTWNVLQSGLRAAVGDYSGTAHILDIPGVTILGKTGTAQSSGDKPNHAWFAGYVAQGKIPLAFCVLLEYGGSSANACEVAREIISYMQRENFL